MGVCMKKVIYSCLLILFVVLFSTDASAQNKHLRIGKIFAKEEANQLFGKPVISIPVRKELLKAALSRADKYIYFSIKGKLPVILNSRRMSLLGDNFNLEPGEKAFGFSREVVEEFLNNTKGQVIYFEIRGINNVDSENRNTTASMANAVFSLSDSYSTLEMSTTCPPFCDPE